MSEWISVKDRLPEVGHPWGVLVFSIDENTSFIEVVEYNYKGFMKDGDTYQEMVTHWMLLPKPPEENLKAWRVELEKIQTEIDEVLND